jgi:thymidylate synthase ThyX
MQLRLGHGAQSEIRSFAYGLLQLTKPHFPVALAEWQKLCVPGLASEEWSLDFINNLSQNKV